jgi:hypothetical protein
MEALFAQVPTPYARAARAERPLREEPGFSGTLNLVDAETGDGITIVLWETAEQAQRPLLDYSPRLRRALGDIAAVLTKVRRFSVLEVNARA